MQRQRQNRFKPRRDHQQSHQRISHGVTIFSDAPTSKGQRWEMGRSGTLQLQFDKKLLLVGNTEGNDNNIRLFLTLEVVCIAGNCWRKRKLNVTTVFRQYPFHAAAEHICQLSDRIQDILVNILDLRYNTARDSSSCWNSSPTASMISPRASREKLIYST